MFKGVSEYLDDLAAYIDAPLLFVLDISFFYDIEFDTPQFMQFISRSPKLREPEKAQITFRDDGARFTSPTSHYHEDAGSDSDNEEDGLDSIVVPKDSAGSLNSFILSSTTQPSSIGRQFKIEILCKGLYWQVSSLG